MNEEKKNVTDGVAGGTYVSGVPLTTETVESAGSTLLANAIDAAIVKVRPMATPLDQISRMGHTRPVDSMEVDYYTVDTRADRDTVISCSKARDVEGAQGDVYAVSVEHPSRFEPSDTFTVLDNPGAAVYYVIEKRADGTLIVAVQGDTSQLPVEGAVIVRMGRAATQLDVQTPQFACLPQKGTNYCQIFK